MLASTIETRSVFGRVDIRLDRWLAPILCRLGARFGSARFGSTRFDSARLDTCFSARFDTPRFFDPSMIRL